MPGERSALLRMLLISLLILVWLFIGGITLSLLDRLSLL